MPYTVQNLCDEALRLIHVLRPNASFATVVVSGSLEPASAEYQIAIDALNMLLDGFSIDGATVYQVTHETFALNGSVSYTWGLGASINTARPVKIRSAAVIQTDGSMPIGIVTPERWDTIVDRTATGSFAEFLVCDYGSPWATISLWPAPAAGTLDLWSIKPLFAVVYLNDTIAFPTGYYELLKFNLAVALASEFPGAVLDQVVMQKAMETKGRLAALNAVTIGQPAAPLGPIPMQMPPREVDIEQGKPLTP